MMYPQQFLSLKEVCTLVGLSRATLYRMIKKGTFPRGVQISERRMAWHIDVVQRWIDDRLQAGDH
ncbi:AlpA family phage regulatory protein [Neiella sp. HB171785]|uniref:AlpA family phage regulatory protein n=1 Tax=Neiella litorisoli TaxID=2771431 RepID=A0A8J6QRA3_9GAMM|nr:AlpA family phage regulatory protein [Neiella litorisoli]MBD1389269.1 AlpA family phage regulatory protein [Neiella litorisoli]